MGEPDVKFDETVFEFISRIWIEYDDGTHYGAISGEVMVKELVEAAMEGRGGDVQEARRV